jgi:hypothetical protein
MGMAPDALSYTPGTMLVFIDETGDEKYTDDRYPIFGRGGCIVMGSEYGNRIVRPWKKMLAQIEWGNRPFHTTEYLRRLGRQNPHLVARQTQAIYDFARHGFYRFGITSHRGTTRPERLDGHEAVSMTLVNQVRRLVAACNPSSVAFVFEDSGRGNRLVRRDFNLDNLGMRSLFGKEVTVDGFFCPKLGRVPGLEVADLIAHTAGRNQRHALEDRPGFPVSFQELFQRAADIGLAYYVRLETIKRIVATAA